MDEKQFGLAQAAVGAVVMVCFAVAAVGRCTSSTAEQSAPAMPGAPASTAKPLPDQYLEKLANPALGDRDRVLVIEALAVVAPDKATPFLAEAKKTRAKMNREQEIEDKRQARINREIDAREAKRKKREGIHIGMTREDVQASNWGKPERTTGLIRADLDVEIWHYPSGSRLYFSKGVLVQILR